MKVQSHQPKLVGKKSLRSRYFRLGILVFTFALGALIIGGRNWQAATAEKQPPQREVLRPGVGNSIPLCSGSNNGVRVWNPTTKKTGAALKPIEDQFSEHSGNKAAVETVMVKTKVKPPEAQTYTRICDARARPQNFTGLYDPEVKDDKNCSDTQFLIDQSSASNGPLDSPLGCQIPSANFNVPIDRYIGDRTKLLSNKLIGATATVRMGAYLSPTTSPPNSAKFLFNGAAVTPHEIAPGFYGARVIDFQVPIETVNFPADGGPPAQNTIRVDFPGNSLCPSYFVDWITINIEVARPVLLVHGFWSHPTTWSEWKSKFNALGLPVETVDLYNGDGTGTMEFNAGQITLKVDELRSRWRMDKINLIGHSKGGLDARLFAEEFPEEVSQLIQIATPNDGSELAALFPRLDDIEINLNSHTAGGSQLRIDYMHVYNLAHPLNRKIHYVSLAGDYTPSNPLISGNDDLVVSIASAHQLVSNEGNVSLLTHSSIFPDKSAAHFCTLCLFGSINSSDSVFELLKPAFGKLEPRNSDEQTVEKKQAIVGSLFAASIGTELQVKSAPEVGSITVGQQKVHNISVDVASHASFALFYPTGGSNDISPQNNLDMTLFAPTGETYSSERVDDEIIGGRIETFSFATISTGVWRIEVTAPTIVQAGGKTSYAILFTGDAPSVVLNGSVVNSRVQAGSFLKLIGTLRNQITSTAITGATVTANVQIPTIPNPTVQTVTLFDNGTNGDVTANDGIYSFDFSTTQQVGLYSVQFIASKAASGTIPAFSRQDTQLATVSSSNSTVAGTFSDGGSNAALSDHVSNTESDISFPNTSPPFTKLVIQAGMNISKAGNYVVLGELIDSANNKLNSSKAVALSAGTQTISLEFDGQQIYRNRVNGSFQLTSIRLIEDTGRERIIVDDRSNLYQTASYQFLDFQTSPLSFGGGTAIGVDINGNGLFELLRTTLQIDAKTSGAYSIAAQVMDQNGKMLDVLMRSVNFSVGTNGIVFDFAGTKIAQNAVDGPYTITGLVVQGQNVSLLQSNLLKSPAYHFYQFEGAVPNVVQFSAGSYSVNEGAGSATITVTRTGNGSATVDYASSDGTASQANDYTVGAGTLAFAAGETSKTFSVLITNDLYVEGSETINLTLNNPGGGVTLGTPSTAVITITDNDSATPTTNPLDGASQQFFVRQHYLDFLSRDADPDGLAYWASQITQCGSDQNCVNGKRVDVSNAFFYELEYQQTGSYVYRLYRAAFGNNQPFANPDNSNQTEARKLPGYQGFSGDRARVVGGVSLSQGQLDLANLFVQRAEFLAKYPASQSGPTFVDAVLATIQNDLGVNLNSQRNNLITLFNSGGRGAVMYRLADDSLGANPVNNRPFIDAEYNRAFVATQYFGYLRRDSDIGGFLFWLGQIDSGPLRDTTKQHAMVCSFITSIEYQQRFSSVVTHSNTECSH